MSRDNYGEERDFKFKVDGSNTIRLGEKYVFEVEEIENSGLNVPNPTKKYFITRNNRIVAIVDSDMKQSEVESILLSSLKSSPNFEYNEANHEIIGNFVREIQRDTKKKVDSVVLNNDKGVYEVVLDGEKYTIPYTENGSISARDVIAKANEADEIANANKVTYNVNEELNEKNKSYLENYYSELYKEGLNNADVQVKKNSDGSYSLFINDVEKVKFAKGTTLSEALYESNNILNNGDALSAANNNGRSSGFNTRNGYNYQVNINPNDYIQVQNNYNQAKNGFAECKGTYNTGMFTDKLLAAYNTLVGAGENVNPQNRINKTTELLNNIITNINYSLQAYYNIDRDMGIILNSVIEEIFNINSYHEPIEGEEDFGNLSYEERVERVETLIKNIDTQLKELQDEYEKTYGHGVRFTGREASFYLTMVHAFNLGDKINISSWENQDTALIHLDDLESLTKFAKENNLFEKLKSYSEGKSWKESGLSELNDHILGWKTNNYDDGDNEQEFLNTYLLYQDEFSSSIYDKYGQNSIYDLTSDNSQNIIKEIKSHLYEDLLYTKTVDYNEDETPNKKVNLFELIDYYSEDEQRMRDDINALSCTLYNYKQYQKLMPFEEEMKSEKFLNYLIQDWSKAKPVTNQHDLQYLTQKEISLYFMYIKTGREDVAKEYIEAMKDLIHQRQGYEEAAERILHYGGVDGFVASGMDGFGDGLEGFMESIANCFGCDGIRSVRDYRNMFMISLLSEDNIYNMQLSPAFKSVLLRNYKVMNSIGNMIIPSLSYFIPYVGPQVSKVFMAASVFGSSVKNAKVNGASDAQAYLYGGFSACSTVLLNKLISGIPGIGGANVPSSVGQFFLNMGKQVARGEMGTILDLGLRSWILNEPVDLSRLPSQLLEVGINSAFVAAVMNGTTKLTLKLADGLTITLSDGKYTSYMDYYKETIRQFNNTPIGRRLTGIRECCADTWKIIKGLHSDNVMIKLASESRLTNSDQFMDLSDQSEKVIGIPLEEYERLIYDNNSKEYYILNGKTLSGMTVPHDWISNHEPGPIAANPPATGLSAIPPTINIDGFSSPPNDMLPSLSGSGNGNANTPADIYPDSLFHLGTPGTSNGSTPDNPDVLVAADSVADVIEVNPVTIISTEALGDGDNNTITSQNDSVDSPVSGNLPTTESETAIIASSKEFSKSEESALAEMQKYFGDPGHEANLALVNGIKTAQEILEKLEGAAKEQFADFLKNTSTGKWLATLTGEEIDALTRRTLNSGMISQAESNGGINPDTGEENPYVGPINSALAKSPGLEENTLLYRGVYPKGFASQFGDAELIEAMDTVDQTDSNAVYSALKPFEGKTYTIVSNLPTSPGYSQASSGSPIIMQIYAEQGVNGAYINPISAKYNVENELLLGQGQEVIIVEVSRDNNPNTGEEQVVVKCIMPNNSTSKVQGDHPMDVSLIGNGDEKNSEGLYKEILGSETLLPEQGKILKDQIERYLTLSKDKILPNMLMSEQQEGVQYKRYATYEDYLSVYGEQSKELFSQLPNEDKILFYHYTRGEMTFSAAKVINPVLRGTAMKGDKYVFKGTSGKTYEYDAKKLMEVFEMQPEAFEDEVYSAAEKMMKVMLKNKLPEATTFYRGVNADYLEEYGIDMGDSEEVMLAKLQETPYHYDPGMMSTTPVLEHDITANKPVILVLNTPAGASVFDMSAVNPDEREVLFPPGTAKHADNVKFVDGKILIYYTVVPSESCQTVEEAIEYAKQPSFEEMEGFKNVDLKADILSSNDESFSLKIQDESMKDLSYTMANETKNNEVLTQTYDDKFYTEYLTSESKVRYATVLVGSKIINGNIDAVEEIVFCLDPEEQQTMIQMMEENDIPGVDIVRGLI